MDSNQNNLFITGTAYHFIAAYHIAKERYSSSSYLNFIYFSKSEQTDYEIPDVIPNSNCKIIRFERESWDELVKMLELQSFKRFFFFHENNIFNKYLAYQLKQKGTIICLGPDGSKPYGIFKKNHEIISMFKDTWVDYKLLKSKGLYFPRLIWSKYYRYGSCKLLDEVWLQYPELFDAVKNKTFCEIEQMPSFKIQFLNDLINYFSFNDQLLFENQKIILYFNQPLNSKSLIDKEVHILSLISEKFPGRKIIVKLHPATQPSVKSNLKKLPFLYIIDDLMPAEFYLAKVYNSIILTGWSAAILHDFECTQNRFYYLFPFFKKVKDKVLSQISIIGFPHVKIIDSLDQLV